MFAVYSHATKMSKNSLKTPSFPGLPTYLNLKVENMGLCVLTMVECGSKPSIDTLNSHLDWYLIDNPDQFSVNTQWTLDQQSVNG